MLSGRVEPTVAAFVEQLLRRLRFEGKRLSEAALLRLSKGRRKRSSALWAVQLSEALVWRTVMQYKCTRVEHINLQEAKARRSLMKRLPVSKRVVVCQDSRVSLGALRKGRSPSESLNRVMRSEAPWILRKNFELTSPAVFARLQVLGFQCRHGSGN